MTDIRIVDSAWVKERIPKRTPTDHKWSVGSVLIIAGSPQYTGAAWLACRAAGRSGAGLVALASGRTVRATLAGVMPEVTHTLLPETDAPGAARRAVEQIRSALAKAGAVLVGPGLGDDEGTQHLLDALFGFGHALSVDAGIGFGFGDSGDGCSSTVAPLFERDDLPIVVDADALTWLSRQDEWWKRVPARRLVLTPHAGEMSRLIGVSANEIAASPAEYAVEAAAMWQQTVLTKSSASFVTNGATSLGIEKTPDALKTAGTGDVLAGSTTAMLAQRLPPLEAAAVALALGSHAAASLTQRYSALGVIATDLPDAIGHALAEHS